MTRHPEPPRWTYWAPSLCMMAVFLIIAINAVLTEEWGWTAVCVLGIIGAALNWRTVNALRERIMIQKRLAATQDYRIAGLEQQLKRERAWRN